MSALAKTASITLITALPGSGKTLRIVTWIKEHAVAEGLALYVADDSEGNRGIKGLKIPHIRFPDPREWSDIPPGSVLVVDEAQDWFRARRSGDPPKYLTDMERIRHRGIRLLIATQQPNYLDTHLRGLVGCHEHLVREEGKEACVIYRHNEIMEDVRSERARNRYDKETWRFPKENYGLYESAEVHTVQRVVKSRTKKGLALGACALVLALAGVYAIKGTFLPGANAEPAGDGGGIAAAVPALRQGAERGEPMDAGTWAARFTPRIPEFPMSAPAYDEREVLAAPQLVCGIGETIGCVCYTEQGTKYAMDQFRCTALVESGGVYDPFREPGQKVQPAGYPIRNEGDFQPMEPVGSAPAPEAATAAATAAG